MGFCHVLQTKVEGSEHQAGSDFLAGRDELLRNFFGEDFALNLLQNQARLFSSG